MFIKRYPHFFFFILLFPFSALAQNFGGSPTSIHWQQVNSEKVRVIFPKGLDSQANRIHNLVSLLDTSINTLGNKHRKWNIVLHTQTTTSNAYVRLAPVISEFYMMPDPNNFTEGSIRWDDNLVVHEHRHMQQLSNFNKGFTKVFSFFLGQEGQLLANGITIPDYFFEGDAVFQETLVTKQGRGRFPYFHNGFKSLWLANKNYSWMKLRSGSYKAYTPDRYRMGYLMLAYGNETYGEDFWKKVTQDAVRFKGVFYSFNKAVQRHSGKTYKQFRQDAIAYFKSKSFPVSNEKPDSFEYISPVKKNNVVDYEFPVYMNDDSILVTKKSYNSLNHFYIIEKGKEKKLRLKNTVIDEQYSYNNGKIVYASYQSDPRWGNRDYSVLQLMDVKTKKQKQLSFKSRYFSPDINKDASEIIAVHVNTDGTNNLHRINAATGAVIIKLSNPNNYFFTQTKYINANTAISAARNPEGKIALVMVDLNTGETSNITPFTFNVVGYPFVKGDTVFFNAMNGYADKVFAVDIKSKKIYRVTNNSNGIYNPVVNNRGEMLVSAFTADGLRLTKYNVANSAWSEIFETEFAQQTDLYTPAALQKKNAGLLYSLQDEKRTSSTYPKSFRLFNFHSRRPVIADPEYGYTFYSDNILGSFSNNLTYTYNRNEHSHSLDFRAVYAGWFPLVSFGAEGIAHRVVDTIIYNSSKVYAGLSLPLSFVGGRTNKFFNAGAFYNIEKLYFRKKDKALFNDEALQYVSSSLSFSNLSRQAKQQVNPRWGQSITTSYRHAFTLRESRKFVGSLALYFPGVSKNHSLLLQGAFQKRDTLADLFSNTFSYSRGYEALSTRRMYKLAANYQLPVLYPDLGVGNIIFLQRIRANAFYDYTNARARFNTGVRDILNRSTGAELFFDTKVWNVLPVTFIVRYSRLLDRDLLNPGAVNKWELIVPIGFIPN